METPLLARLTEAARTVTPLAPVAAVSPVMPDLKAGEQVRAEVAARLDDGSFRVLIDGKPLKLTLPAEYKPGDVLTLRVLSREPQLRFELIIAPAAGKTTVSDAGRLIGALVREAPGSPPRQTQPILEVPTAEPSELTGPLARAVERSGLFYESHQARWLSGDYPLERLREEPQATTAKSPEPGTPAGAKAPIPAGPGGVASDDVIPGQNSQPMGDTANRATMGDESRPELVARETLPIVRQQLETLETRNIGWLGEIWPGQAMRWEIADESRESEHAAAEQDWSTRFGLSLPGLGEVGAALALSPHGLQISFTARDAATVESMRSSAPELARALEAAGIETTGIKVSQGDASI